MNTLVKKFCIQDDLSTYDPYDIWKTRLGIFIKDNFNKSKYKWAIPALFLTLTDLLNNRLRLGYDKQEYPIVRSLAALTLLNCYESSKEQYSISIAEIHLDWLVKNSSKGYSGACWGIGFKWAAAPSVIYTPNTPHATHTPYALEAFHKYTLLTNDDRFTQIIESCFSFFEYDLHIMYEDEEKMAISYGPLKDRIVTNALSYVMYSYAILLSYFPDRKDHILNKIHKLFNFIADQQQEDGSWFYLADTTKSFVDCFHSCFILKNIIKTQELLNVKLGDEIIAKGYRYLLQNFIDDKTGLFKRFSVSNKPSFIKYDLYDNAEMLNLSKLLEDKSRVLELDSAIKKYFVKGNNIYSAIDFVERKINKNTLRWAVMPYLYTLSTLK